MRPSFRLRVACALDAEGRLLAPADWTVVRGTTRSLVAAGAGGPDPLPLLLLPGLVNAHAHLDLGEGEAVPSGDSFPDWLLGIGRERRRATDVGAVAGALSQRLAGRGVVAVGDIDANAGRPTLGRRRAGLAGRSYLEIVGVGAGSARARLAQALERIDRLGGAPGGLGLSPHAPYSVHAEVVPEIVRAARARRLPLAMHLAETEEETRYLLTGDGPFRRFLEIIGRGRPFPAPPRVRPIVYAERTGFLETGGLVVHGNDLDDEDLQILARARSSVVYCHGTHSHFARPRHRLLELAAAGVNVALGTDSAASNRGVDLLSELCRLAADRPDVPPQLLLRAATLGGRLALRLPSGAARFAPGSRADALLLGEVPADLPSRAAQDVAGWALSGDGEVASTLHAGRPVPGPRPGDRPGAGWLDSLDPPR